MNISSPCSVNMFWNFCWMLKFRLSKLLNMSYMLPHLTNGWQVDQAIQHEEDKVSNTKYRSNLPLGFKGSVLIGQFRWSLSDLDTIGIRLVWKWMKFCFPSLKNVEILPFSTFAIFRKFPISTRCMSCTIRAPVWNVEYSCFNIKQDIY